MQARNLLECTVDLSQPLLTLEVDDYIAEENEAGPASISA